MLLEAIMGLLPWILTRRDQVAKKWKYIPKKSFSQANSCKRKNLWLKSECQLEICSKTLHTYFCQKSTPYCEEGKKIISGNNRIFQFKWRFKKIYSSGICIVAALRVLILVC